MAVHSYPCSFTQQRERCLLSLADCVTTHRILFSRERVCFTMKSGLLLRLGALAGAAKLAAAECPNACSGRGTCGAYDMCSCYTGYMGNDCSERVCPFGLAHVDSPKGDLDMDNEVEPSIVATGSQVYPYGTAELFPVMKTVSDS